jgi:hypothetical protein
MQNHQDIIKKMLFWLHQICIRHNLRYMACGGTLIGAARHQGLIPWDGDADVAMPIEDCIKLHRIVTGIDDPYWINKDGSWTSSRTPVSGSLSKEDPDRPFVKKFNLPNDLFFQTSATDFNIAGRIIKIRSKEYYNIPASRGPSHAGVQLDIFPVTVFNNHILINYESSADGYDWHHVDEVFPLVSLPFEDREIFCAKNYKFRLKDAFGSEIPALPPEGSRRSHEGQAASLKERPLDYYLTQYPHLYNQDLSLKDCSIDGKPYSVDEFLCHNQLRVLSPDNYTPSNTNPRGGIDPFWKLFSKHPRTKNKHLVN